MTTFNVALSDSAAFVTTHWSVVISASKPDTSGSARALDKLCRAYWDPLYAYVRRRGYDRHDAEDLIQSFFARLLKRNDFAVASPNRGRFRSYLLGTLKHFLANDWRERRTRKRGGGRVMLSLDAMARENRYLLEPADHLTPEVLYDRRWASTLLSRVKECLRAEFVAADKARIFEEIKEFLFEKQSTAHAEIAARHGLSVNAVGVAIHRMRRRYGELVMEEIRQTVRCPEEVVDELRHLIAASGR